MDVSGRENTRRKERGRSSPADKARDERASLRLQDRELQEMSDGGWCLSMHQPWASLLVRGIKRRVSKKPPTTLQSYGLIDLFGFLLCRVEGRTWYTSHRGRLWIAAAAKKPTPQEIAEVEAIYRHIYGKGKCAVRGELSIKLERLRHELFYWLFLWVVLAMV